MKKRIAVVGGGASGMMAAVAASEAGADVTLIEKNEKLGKKLFITGKGRCNLSNACDRDAFFDHVLRNPRFLYSAMAAFSIEDTLSFFERKGLELKVERGDRVFPASDHSSDVIRVLTGALEQSGVKILLNTKAERVETKDGRVFRVTAGGKLIPADSVVLAGGGVSYPSTGADESCFKLAEEVRHTRTPLIPALVPMAVKEQWVKELMGLSLRNVAVRITSGGKCLYQDFGEMLFTHFGVSGPLMLSAASVVGERLLEENLILHIDLKPALTPDQLDARLLRELSEHRKKQFRNAVSSLFPAKLLPVIVERSGISPYLPANELGKKERKSFCGLIKDFTLTLTNLRGFDEAIVTRGGIPVREIDPRTMESKLVKGLYFAGEMMDVDAFTGGFNLQIAWSTGYLAGISAAGADERRNR